MIYKNILKSADLIYSIIHSFHFESVDNNELQYCIQKSIKSSFILSKLTSV
jgi:hypothetical protein